MATNYPTSLDTSTQLPTAATLTGQDLDDFPHSTAHGNAHDAIIAVETELGTAPSGSSATVKARFEVIEADDWATDARIGAPTTGSLDSGNIQYARMGNIVHVWTTATSTGATLPSGFRPAAALDVPGAKFDGGNFSGGIVEISTAGVISMSGDASDLTFAVSFSTV